MTYKASLKLSFKLWLWLFKHPGKGKRKSPYWRRIKKMNSNCPLCERYHKTILSFTCSPCILYQKRCCEADRANTTFLKWYRSISLFNAYECENDRYKAKLAAARIASVLRREYRRVKEER